MFNLTDGFTVPIPTLPASVTTTSFDASVAVRVAEVLSFAPSMCRVVSVAGVVFLNQLIFY